LDPEDFAGWEMIFKAFVVFGEEKLLKEPEPRVTEDEEASETNTNFIFESTKIEI
jgi:hypothetical protein